MTVQTIQQIFDEAVKRGVTTKTAEARTWYQNMAMKTGVDTTKFIKEDLDRLQSKLNQFSIGRMYLFYYDAKLKNKPSQLPIWDRYPLIYPIDLQKDGFLGINLHYLPPKLRAVLMDNLDAIKNNKKYDDSTKLKISYGLLKSAARFKYFKPCIKKYLNNNVRSRFMYIKPNEWPLVVFLPLQKWVSKIGYTQGQVWADSTKKASGRK